MITTDIELKTASIKNLLIKVTDLSTNRSNVNYSFFGKYHDDFSKVTGLSETEINDFINLYNSTLHEISNIIRLTENPTLLQKLTTEYQNLPTFDTQDYVIPTDNFIKFLQSFNPFKFSSKSREFYDKIDQIKWSCEHMLSYFQFEGWLDIK